MKKVYQLTIDGYYAGEAFADESPEEPGVFHIPAYCIEVEPPKVEEGKILRFVNNEWMQEDLPSNEVEEEPPRELTYADKRRMEYPPIWEYLDGIVKGDKEQVKKYIADCLAVKEKYPKPE